ncbi:hypothetical protein C8Q74DRAFT_1164353, partial [Fomes fomentarius]
VALNTLLFLFLIFGLSATTFGFMVKQWIHEGRVEDLRLARDTARRRWYRSFNMTRWKVNPIIGFLFLVFQLSFVLFFVGLLLLTWHLHSTMAVIATVFVGIFLVAVLITTLLPLILSHCCFLSPLTY